MNLVSLYSSHKKLSIEGLILLSNLPSFTRVMGKLLLFWETSLFSANCVHIVTKYRSLKRAFQGDSAGTIAKK